MCLDIDECSRSESTCHQNAKCTNTVGSFDCACNQNYYGNGYFCAEGQCDDANCPQNQTCISPTTVDCQCKQGFSLNELDECVDTDECSQANDCDINAECKNSVASYDCICNSVSSGNGTVCNCIVGYSPNEKGLCLDIDECATKDRVE